MPNWARGNIRIRGKRDNILEFLRSELIAVDENFGMSRPVVVEENQGGWSLIVRRPCENCDVLFFRGSDGQYVLDFDGGDIELPLSEGPNKNVDQILVLEDFSGAWDIDRRIFPRYAQDYKIDIRLFVWECGMCWSTVATYYKDGRVDCEDRRYSDWLWDSPMPFYGG